MIRYLKALWFITTAVGLTVIAFLTICVSRLFSYVGLANHHEYAHRVATFWGKSMFFLTPGWKIDTFGMENLPEQGDPVVYVANHQSNADIWAVYFISRRFSWLSKAEVFKIPMVGTSMRWARYIGIDRGNKSSHRMAMQQSVTLLRENISMFFFPEGTRSKDKRIKDFKAGAFRLAKEANVDIQPLVIKGTGDLLEKGSIVPSGRAKVELHVLPRIKSKDLDADKLSEVARKAIVDKYQTIYPEAAGQTQTAQEGAH